MNFLLDTHVVSEWTKPQPNPGVVAWLANVDEDRVFISVITLAELRHGVEKMNAGTRRDRLDTWLSQQIPGRFDNRILTIDPETADHWGRIMARCQAAGRRMSSNDGFIAATARQHDMDLITRNTTDFETSGIRLINPWREE